MVGLQSLVLLCQIATKSNHLVACCWLTIFLLYCYQQLLYVFEFHLGHEIMLFYSIVTDCKPIVKINLNFIVVHAKLATSESVSLRCLILRKKPCVAALSSDGHFKWINERSWNSEFTPCWGITYLCRFLHCSNITRKKRVLCQLLLKTLGLPTKQSIQLQSTKSILSKTWTKSSVIASWNSQQHILC